MDWAHVPLQLPRGNGYPHGHIQMYPRNLSRHPNTLPAEPAGPTDAQLQAEFQGIGFPASHALRAGRLAQLAMDHVASRSVTTEILRCAELGGKTNLGYKLGRWTIHYFGLLCLTLAYKPDFGFPTEIECVNDLNQGQDHYRTKYSLARLFAVYLAGSYSLLDPERKFGRIEISVQDIVEANVKNYLDKQLKDIKAHGYWSAEKIYEKVEVNEEERNRKWVRGLLLSNAMSLIKLRKNFMGVVTPQNEALITATQTQLVQWIQPLYQRSLYPRGHEPPAFQPAPPPAVPGVPPPPLAAPGFVQQPAAGLPAVGVLSHGGLVPVANRAPHHVLYTMEINGVQNLVVDLGHGNGVRVISQGPNFGQVFAAV